MKRPLLLELVSQLPGPLVVPSDADWSALPLDAERHGLAGLLADAVARQPDLAPGAEPPAAQRALRAAARSSAAQAMKLHRLLLDALARLAPKGVAPVLMKGYGFGHRYWPDPLLRPASDVDLLVEPALLDAVAPELVALGLARFEDAGEDDVFEHHHHLGFHGPRGIVELHFRLLAGFGGAKLGDDEVFARCRRAELGGFPVRYLDPVDELVYLASHAAQHLFLRVAWLYDLKLLVGRERLDWDRVAALARASSLRASTHAALLLAREKLDAAVPAEALRALAPTRLHAGAVRRAFSDRQLVSAELARSKAASALRATLSDDPVRAARHLAQGLARNVRRRARS